MTKDKSVSSLGDYIDQISCVDCLIGAKKLPPESVHLVFTSPPYFNAREYSQFKTYADYLEFLSAIIAEAHRVLKEGRFFVLNTSPVIEDRKVRNDQSTRRGIPFDLHPIIMERGFMFIDDIIWAKPEPSTKNRNATFFKYKKPLTYKPNSITEYVMVYRKKTGKLIDWNLKQYDESTTKESLVLGSYESSNLWRINPDISSDHPAPFPEELSDRIVSYYSFKGDVVLDPFVGSGTTAVSCKKLRRHFVGFDSSESFCEMARKRVKNAVVSNDIANYFKKGKTTITDFIKSQRRSDNFPS